MGPSYGAGRHKRLPREIPWRRAWQPTPVFLPGETNGQRCLAGYSPKDCKESGMTEATWHTCHRPWHYASLSPDKSLYTFFFLNYHSGRTTAWLEVSNNKTLTHPFFSRLNIKCRMKVSFYVYSCPSSSPRFSLIHRMKDVVHRERKEKKFFFFTKLV